MGDQNFVIAVKGFLELLKHDFFLHDLQAVGLAEFFSLYCQSR